MTALPEPVLVPPSAGHRAVLVWRPPTPPTALSSASVGGGLTAPAWVLNAAVDAGFARTDLEEYVAELAASLRLEGHGCALLTAADVGQVRTAEDGGVQAWATVGVTRPTWAVRPGHARTPADGRVTTFVHEGSGPPAPGTVNIVVSLPVPLTTSALVQAVGTATEAKAQALLEAGVPGTGTASDAVVVACPPADGVEVAFAGVRSTWGSRVARAVRAAVADGLAAHPWPPPDAAPDEVGVVW